MRRGPLRFILAAILAAHLGLPASAQDPAAQRDAPAAQDGAPSQGAGTPQGAAPAQGAPAPQDQAPADQPIFRTDINFVRVDVIVTDRQGQPVHDLRQEDFEVSEDGTPQTIQTFKLINVSEYAGVGVDPPREVRNAIEEQAEAARDDVRLFAVFLDDYHVRLENSMRARETIAQFIERLQPADMAGVMYPLWSIHDVLLTRNRTQVAGAIRQFTGRKYDYTPRNEYEDRYVHYVSTMEAERIRNQVTLSALKGLIVKLGGLREGRKAIVLVSEGFVNSLPAQVQDPIAARPGSGGRSRPDSTDPAMKSRMESVDFFMQSELIGDLRSVWELANRYNTTIYTVDPRGLAPFEFDVSQPNVSFEKDRVALDTSLDTLRMLASETDGRAILNTNDLDRGLRQIISDSSAYYLLGYTSTLAQPDGKFHKINVRVKRPGLQIRARPGYLALTATEVERALAPKTSGPPPAVAEALATLATTSRRRSLIASWIGMSPGADGKTKVSIVWTPAPVAAGSRQPVPATISVTAGSANSDLYFRRRGIAPGRVEFEVPPGPVELDIGVEGTDAEVLDRESRKLVVPALGLGLTLSTPQVFRGRTLPEWQKLSADPAALPAIEREFRRTDRLLVRIGAQSAAGTPQVGARILNRAGSEMSSLTVAPASFGQVHQVDVPLAALPVGDYLVEVTANDGGEKTSTLVAFRVVP